MDAVALRAVSNEPIEAGREAMDKNTQDWRDDEERAEVSDRRDGPADRRYRPSVRDTNWPAIFAALITMNLALLGYATSLLNDIKRDGAVTKELQLKYSTTYEIERGNTKEQLQELKNKVDTIVIAFQYNVNGRLNYLEYKTGHKAPPESLRPPQQPQLQGD